MGELIVNDAIEVETSHGQCLVEVCSGSITALNVKDRVDTIVISAFPGDYSPTPSSVVGALLRDLRINVRNLAQNKEEDLRRLFSCWWSKPLPDGLPYGRLLCFEGSFKKNTTPPSTVSEVFRSLVSLAKNKDMTAIMPLLAAGDQGYDKCMMLGLIVNAAVNWMQTGLPLKRLKIVLFSRNPTKPDKLTQNTINHFETLKKEWIAKWKETTTKREITHDVYLSHSITDKAYLQNVLEGFKQDNKELRIYSKYQKVDANSSWQKEIFEVISSCAKVVALLTPNYILEESCIEQFNIAMCYSRQQNMLAPFYMQAIVQMPTYMGLIQYIDCRALDTDTISDACSKVITTYQIEKVRFTEEDKELITPTNLNQEYDVFISYCHQDMEVAVKIVEQIKQVLPDCKIFFDQNDLQIGTTWQLKLYASVENTKCMVALLSKSYLDSRVCQEEYNLARAMNDDPNYKTSLLEIKLKDVEEWPIWCSPVHLFDVSQADDEKRTQVVNYAIAKISKKLKLFDDKETKPKYMGSISQITSRWRHAISTYSYPIVSGTKFKQTESFKSIRHKYQSKHKFDVLLSYHKEDKHFAEILMKELVGLLPYIKISFPVDEKLRLHEIDQATVIIPLLSDSYVNSSEHMEEFHTALCRHRFSEEIVFFPITVRVLPMRPVYPQIVFNLFSLVDDFWALDSNNDPKLCLSVAAVVVCNLLVREPRVTTAFRTLFSMREIKHSADELLLRCNTSLQLPLHFFSLSVDSNVWCLNEYGQVDDADELVRLECIEPDELVRREDKDDDYEEIVKPPLREYCVTLEPDEPVQLENKDDAYKEIIEPPLRVYGVTLDADGDTGQTEIIEPARREWAPHEDVESTKDSAKSSNIEVQSADTKEDVPISVDNTETTNDQETLSVTKQPVVEPESATEVVKLPEPEIDKPSEPEVLKVAAEPEELKLEELELAAEPEVVTPNEPEVVTPNEPEVVKPDESEAVKPDATETVDPPAPDEEELVEQRQVFKSESRRLQSKSGVCVCL